MRREKYGIGLMSGTSLDGLDVVYVRFDEGNSYKILEAETYTYPQKWGAVLKNIASIPKGDQRLKDLDVALGKYFSERLILFMVDHQIQFLDFIASHGHTVHHQPQEKYTLQIGCGQEIFKAIEVPVVYDFRKNDVALGGQGAPLVPIGDKMLFPEYDYCLNLGGFGNVSFQENGLRKAYDICPVNIVLNHYAQKIGFPYDHCGELSSQGELCQDLFDELNKIDYYQQEIPKSLGVEFVHKNIFPLIEKYKLVELDVLRTFVEHIAFQLSLNLQQGQVLVTGGGAYHGYLLERVLFYNPRIDWVVPNKELIEYKEALVFALLGKLKLEGEMNCLSSVTGALKNHSTGTIISF